MSSLHRSLLSADRDVGDFTLMTRTTGSCAVTVLGCSFITRAPVTQMMGDAVSGINHSTVEM